MNIIESKIDVLYKKVVIAIGNGDNSQSYLLLQQAHQQLLLIYRNNLLWVCYYLNLASVYNNMGRFTDCIDCCKCAEQISSLKGNDDLIAKIKSIKSTAYLNTGDYKTSIKNIKEAIQNYSKALLIAKKNKNKLLEGKSLMALGSVFMGHRFLYLVIP